MTEIPNIVPLPSISLTDASMNNAKVKPKPMPKASRIEYQRPFLLANASALPSIMQFTTISGINMPNAAFNSGEKALISRSTIVTKVAITTM